MSKCFKVLILLVGLCCFLKISNATEDTSSEAEMQNSVGLYKRNPLWMKFRNNQYDKRQMDHQEENDDSSNSDENDDDSKSVEYHKRNNPLWMRNRQMKKRLSSKSSRINKEHQEIANLKKILLIG